ncbi:DUF1659 domain-containing protein [Bacillus solimangrovi]|uniref:DUF1659 domain-containing protein n=1 Tax=Bacillus solimangrovi TaxID=1305675 RepID=A0A1E5LEC1_9BACI|nr:DUF1659 domain-containing protein [Bacillus solimangrovi]OEH92433.1 hypothetical protein BFG57_15740 [Bacillus solimangrovi]
MVEQIITKSKLRLVYDAGMGELGEMIEKTKTYNNVKAEASAEGLFAVAQALNNLTTYSMIEVGRENDYELVSN